MVNVQQHGNNRLNADSQVVVFGDIFKCHGRLTGYLVSLNQNNIGDDYPHIQIWRPTFISDIQKSAYVRISEYVLTENDIVEMENYYFANVSFAVNETTQLQPLDVIGYYQPPSPHYTVWSVNNTGIVAGNFSISQTSQGTIITDTILNQVNDNQPLIQILYGMLTYSYVTS